MKKIFAQTSIGFSLIEVMLAAALFMILASGAVVVILQGLDSNRLGEEQTVATYYATEGIEAARSIMNQNFDSIVNTTGTGVVQVGSNWAFSGSNSVLESKYTRILTISDVRRDVSGNIIATGGTVDPLAKKVTATVTWNFSPTRTNSVELITYLTNWRKSILGDWSAPAQEATFDLTTANSGNSSADTNAIAFSSNKIYLGRASGGGREFYIFDVSNPAAPTLLGQRDLNGTPRDIVINGNYAYIASDDNSSELQIIDISDPSTIANAEKLTTVDLNNTNSNSNNNNAIALALSGNYLTMIRDGGDEFLIFDLANPTAPGNPIGRSSAITGTPTDLAVAGNYAYVSSTDNATEFQVIDITTKSAPNRVATLDLNSGNNNADGLSVAVAGTYVLVGRSSTAAPDLYSISISSPLSPSLASTLDIGGDVRSIHFDSTSGLAFLSTGDASSEFKVVDASNGASLPAVLGSLNVGSSPVKVVYNEVLDRAFLSSSDNDTELLILRPQ